MIRAIMIAISLLCASPVTAQDTAYYNGEGEPVIALSSQLVSGRQVTVLLDHNQQSLSSVKRGLAGGGDIIWRDEQGIIRVRKTAAGGIIYYPDYRPKGVPLLKDIAPHTKMLEFKTLGHWAKAYPYKGKTKGNPESH